MSAQYQLVLKLVYHTGPLLKALFFRMLYKYCAFVVYINKQIYYLPNYC